METRTWNNFNGTLDGSSDNSDDLDDALLVLEMGVFNFGYLKSFKWSYMFDDYQFSLIRTVEAAEKYNADRKENVQRQRRQETQRRRSRSRGRK